MSPTNKMCNPMKYVPLVHNKEESAGSMKHYVKLAAIEYVITTV